MNLRLAFFMVESMNSDSEIFDFMVESNFDLNLCTMGIPEIKDLEFLDELSFLTMISHPEVSEFAQETREWRENLKKRSLITISDTIEFSETEERVYA